MRKSNCWPMGLKMKQIMQLCGGIVVVLWLASSLLSYILDRCQGRAYTYQLCQEYKNGVIAGDLCSALCTERTIYLSGCDEKEMLQPYRTYRGSDTIYRVKTRHIDTVIDGNRLETKVFEHPKNGTSMEQFQQMVTDFLMEKIGTGDHTDLVRTIMDVADVNHDAKVTLAEAKTIWSLLQHNEFFILLVFHRNEHTPNLKGFCGDMYAVEDVHSTYLYYRPAGGFVDSLFPRRYSWHFPGWEKRAKVVMGMLEFASEVYQHGSQGAFYMCGVSEANVGYNEHFDTKFMDVSSLLPRQELYAYVREQTCTTSRDCVYTSHCTTSCDAATNKCSDTVLHPNLHLVCQIIEPYVKLGAPAKIKGDLITLFDRCLHLTSGNRQELEHSLLLNDFKSLLWQQISTMS